MAHETREATNRDAKTVAALMAITEREALPMVHGEDLLSALEELTYFMEEAVEMDILNRDEMDENGMLKTARDLIAKARRWE